MNQEDLNDLRSKHPSPELKAQTENDPSQYLRDELARVQKDNLRLRAELERTIDMLHETGHAKTEAELTVEYLCAELESEKQRYAEAFVDAEKYDKQTREIEKLRAENEQLRSEIETPTDEGWRRSLEKKQKTINSLRAELDKQAVKLADKSASIEGLLEKWRDAEKENGELRAELAAEIKKREEAEDVISAIHHALRGREITNTHITAIDASAVYAQAERAEAQVEVLREALEQIEKVYKDDDLMGGKTIVIASNVLINLPARAEKVKAVLDAADRWEKENLAPCEPYDTPAEVALAIAVRERREK